MVSYYPYYYQDLVLYLVAQDDCLIKVLFEDEPLEDIKEELTPFLQQTIKQFDLYFSKKHNFDLPLSFSGTVWQEKVWNYLLTIPYGTTVSYKDVAVAVGNKNGSRAVGNAVNKNPLPIVIPCHRVIGTNKKLVGYGGGLAIKEILLALESKYL